MFVPPSYSTVNPLCFLICFLSQLQLEDCLVFKLLSESHSESECQEYSDKGRNKCKLQLVANYRETGRLIYNCSKWTL